MNWHKFRLKEESDSLGRMVKTHVQLTIPDRSIYAYGRMERLSAPPFQDEKNQNHETHYFRVKRGKIKRMKEIVLASIDQDLISDSPTVSARNTSRGNAIIKLMMMVVIGLVPLMDAGMMTIITNPSISSEQVFNSFFLMTVGIAVAVALIFTVYYMLGFIDVHLVDCESLDSTRSPGPIPVYLSHPDRGKAKDYLVKLNGESKDVLDAHAEAVRLLNSEKMLELTYTIETLEHEGDSLKMSLQNNRRRGEDASRYTRRNQARSPSAWPIMIAFSVIIIVLVFVFIFG